VGVAVLQRAEKPIDVKGLYDGVVRVRVETAAAAAGFAQCGVVVLGSRVQVLRGRGA
jgi:hypothetical protein